MKKVFLYFFSLMICSTTIAQNNFVGTWNGKLVAGDTIVIVLHVNISPNGLMAATFDSPTQKMFGIKCDKAEVVGDSIHTTISKLKVSYVAKLVNDSTLSGTFTQNAHFPLHLYKNGVTISASSERPQTPKPPFPYNVQEVIYKNVDQTLQYGGTITIPQGKGPFPAALLITGSGQQDRDETLFNHKPFAVIADALTRDGFVVLRVDDRGIGSSTGNFFTSTTADFINDVNTSIDYLKTRPEVDKRKIGLLGHSEGGFIAPAVASSRNDIDFIILLAAPGVPIIDLMAEQNAAILKSNNINPTIADSYKALYKDVLQTIIHSTDSSTLKQQIVAAENNWLAKTDSNTAKILGFTSEQNKQQFAVQFATINEAPWLKYFITLDPTAYLNNLKKVKVLALNGSKDVQVVASQNLPALAANLRNGRTKIFSTQEMPGLNHLFQTCNKCTVQEYGQLTETFAPAALQVITNWLNKNVK